MDSKIQEINVDNWEQFEEQLKGLRKQTIGQDRPPLLFRGQEKHGWKLETTLERKGQKNLSLLGYHDLISRVQPQIETFTGLNWDIPESSEYKSRLCAYGLQMSTLLRLLIDFPSVYSYMIYLRHHGFPSPLLDWTRLPYVAAYFAFGQATEDDKGKVSIYLLWNDTKGVTIGKPSIARLGSYVRSHKRHFLQQSDYTVCTNHDGNEWYYASHEDVFSSNANDICQGDLWKFNIPSIERRKVLRHLDSYNLNAFSLFGSEESLMETMALRGLDFGERDF